VKKVFGIFLLAMGLVLTGCSKMSTAATVGSDEITLEQLQSEVDSILASRKGVDTSQMELETGEALTRSHLSFIIANRIIEEIAKDLKIDISKSDLDAYRLEIYANIGGEANLPSILVSAGIPKEAVDHVLRRDLIIRSITEAEKSAGVDDAQINEDIKKLVADKSDALKIVVNPRYGKWDVTTLSVVETEPTGDAVKTK
jgi:hypothetical protein